MNGVQFRRGNKEDAADLMKFIDVHLRKDYFMPKAKLQHILEEQCVYIAVHDGIIIAYAHVGKNRRLFNLLVSPDYRNKGIGRELISLCNATSIRCKLNMSTGDPTEYYKKLGFGLSGQSVRGTCNERGKSNRTKDKSIQIMIKGAHVPILSSFE